MASPATGSVLVNSASWTEGGSITVADGHGGSAISVASELGSSPQASIQYLVGWPDVGETIEINDGSRSVVFEAVNGGSPSPGNVGVERSNTSENAHANLFAAIESEGLNVSASRVSNTVYITRNVAGELDSFVTLTPDHRGWCYSSASIVQSLGRDVFRFDGRSTSQIAADIEGIIVASGIGITTELNGSVINLTNDINGEDGNVPIETSNVGAEATVSGMNGGATVVDQNLALIHEQDGSGNATGRMRALKSSDKYILKPDEMEVWLGSADSNKQFVVKDSGGSKMFWVDGAGKGYFAGGVEIVGGVTEITSTNAQVTDPMLLLAKDNASDALDIGFVGKYVNGATDTWAGVVRDADDGVFKFFSTEEDLDATNVVDVSDASYSKGTIDAFLQFDDHLDNAAGVVINSVSEDLSHANGAKSSQLVTAEAAKAYADSVVAAGTFSGLTDTNFSSLTNNDVLTYDSGTGKWLNEAIGSASGLQAYSAMLDSLAALDGTGGDLGVYLTAANTAGTFALTAAARSLLDDADVSTMRTTLGLAIGTDVQEYNDHLAAIAGLSPTDGGIIVGNGSTFVLETGNTARTSLGLGTGNTPTFSGVDINGSGNITATGTGILGLNGGSGGGVGAVISTLQGTGGYFQVRNSFGTSMIKAIQEAGGSFVYFGTDDIGISGMTDDLSASAGAAELATADAIKSYVDSVAASADALAELADVTITSVASGEVLVYTGAGWENQTLVEAGIQAQSDVLDDIAALGANAADGEFLVGTGAGALAWESGATARASLGLVIGTDVQAWGANLDDIAALATTDGGIIVGDGSNFVLESGATARASLGLVIGTDVQAYDAELAAIAGLTSAADKVPYFTGSGTADVADLSAFGRSLIDDADAAAARGTLGIDSDDDVSFASVTTSGNADIGGDIILSGEGAIQRDIGVAVKASGDLAPSVGNLVSANDDPDSPGNDRVLRASANDSTYSVVLGAYMGSDGGNAKLATNGDVVSITVENQTYAFMERIVLGKATGSSSGLGTKVGGTNAPAPGGDDEMVVVGYCLEDHSGAATSTLKCLLQIQPPQAI